ncbi:hypothetical protein CYMTET_4264 [Cymbomonas tetramitiformis]|uniref:Uncharacterized protein n=1 Tax=Cymbomonas tetramitiformis TaxID=36881 RepID=A0AAE0H1N3_9CHLO|nr:hypothetical protein CYMTET_4264 [Cymbomonas tetramitiformis]
MGASTLAAQRLFYHLVTITAYLVRCNARIEDEIILHRYHDPVDTCGELGGVGDLNTTCLVHTNTSFVYDVTIDIRGAGSLILSKNTYVTCEIPGCELHIEMQGNCTLDSNALLKGGNIILACANVVMENGTFLDTSGLATRKSGPQDAGIPTYGMSGGGHGGQGASCSPDSTSNNTPIGGDAYPTLASYTRDWKEEVMYPEQCGASGTGVFSYNSRPTLGGSGGGIINVTARNLFVLRGSVLANGIAPSDGVGGGGGAGGGIYVKANAVKCDSGSPGIVSVQGGNGVQSSPSQDFKDGGGGAGGRVAIDTKVALPAFFPGGSLMLSASGGLSSGACRDTNLNGGPGTIYTHFDRVLTLSNMNDQRHSSFGDNKDTSGPGVTARSLLSVHGEDGREIVHRGPNSKSPNEVSRGNFMSDFRCQAPFVLRMGCSGIGNDIFHVISAKSVAARQEAPLVLAKAYCKAQPLYTLDAFGDGDWHWLGTEYELRDLFRTGNCALRPHEEVLIPQKPNVFGRVDNGTFVEIPLSRKCASPSNFTNIEWFSIVAKDLLRPTPKLLNRLNIQRSHDVSVHIRQGDACRQQERQHRHCVRNFGKVAKLISEYFNYSSVYIATESESFLDHAVKLLPGARISFLDTDRDKYMTKPLYTTNESFLLDRAFDLEKTSKFHNKAQLLEDALSDIFSLSNSMKMYIGQFYSAFSRLGFLLGKPGLEYISIDEKEFCCEAACSQSVVHSKNSFSHWIHRLQSSQKIV